MLIGIDIDGTLCDIQENFFDLTILENIEYYSKVNPKIDIIEKVGLLSQRHTINIITARSSCFREVTEQWLSTHGVCYDSLTMGMEYCDKYYGDNYYNVDDL